MYQWKLEFGLQPTIHIKAKSLADAIEKSGTAYTPMQASYFDKGWHFFTDREIVKAVCAALEAKRSAA
jgi:hypothetical protein